MEYDFTFVISGVSVDDQTAVDALRDECDALLARAGGVDLLSMTGSGESAVEAAVTAVSAAQAAEPRLRIDRLDRDLVGVQEIAERTGRSRQNVSQWVAGTRKGEGAPFPMAEGTVGRSQAWLWSEVNEWLAVHELDDGAAYPTRAEMAEIDVAIANAVTLTFVWADAPEFQAGRKRVLKEFESKHIPGFMNYLSGLDRTTNEQGAHVLVIADESEPARGVMECVARYPHDVILVTTTDQFMAVVLSTRAPHRPTELLTVTGDATVREWLRLVQENPHAAFALDNAEQTEQELAPIQRRLAIAA
ncbi:hypothetical protein NX801_25365 [Streptomyces sp. LP05-1]|uniref:Transcriptional regulator n=1 Tax=Streptomyces pyxinae TaxID=2970734 RepID=A0ABT2CNA3_9ACTN|nr:hypothetical protein [Streptomyces sp. LP05-1]MCS0638918.1 hypothetical protein [Streptomyces sp. LP05-1]